MYPTLYFTGPKYRDAMHTEKTDKTDLHHDQRADLACATCLDRNALPVTLRH